MKQNLLIIGSVLIGSLALALFSYWKNGREPRQSIVAVHTPLTGSLHAEQEPGSCDCTGAGGMPQPGIAVGPPSPGPYYWSFPHCWPYFHGWARKDTLPAEPFWVHPPVRPSYSQVPGQNLAIN
jgi:hypothetical protein